MKLKKLKYLKFSFMAIVAFMAIMLITGCSDDIKTTVGAKTGGLGGGESSGGTQQNIDHYDIVGTVINDLDDPIEHVFIDIIEFVMTDGGEEPFVASVRSDGNGEFGIRIPGDNPISQVTLRFAYQTTVSYVQDVTVIANQAVDLETITLTVMSQKTITDSTIANTLTDNVRANAYVVIGADTLEYSDGTPFTTVLPEVAEGEDEPDPITATVAIGYVDTTTNTELFPDNLYSFADGSLRLFSTYGILEIKVTTDNGNTPLNLAAGQTAIISIPVGDLVNVNDPDFPATIDMWYYDEDVADWVLEQEDGLTYDADTRSFVGVVTHFSAYNSGYSFESRYVQASVMDDRGMICEPETYDENDECTVDLVPYLVPLPGATVEIFSDQFSPYGVWNATYTAGMDGLIPNSMDPSLTGFLYNDEDGYFLRVPGTGDLSVIMEYEHPRTGELESIGPELIVFEEGEIKASRDWLLPLSVSAWITAEVYYANGDPATGAALMFNNPNPVGGGFVGGVVNEDGILAEGAFNYFTWSWYPVQGGELSLAVVPNIDTYCLVTSGDAATAFVEVRYNNANGDLVEEIFSRTGEKFAEWNLGDIYERWEEISSPVLTSGGVGEILNIYVIMADLPTDVKYTYLRGTIDLEDIPAGVNPDDLWVVIDGIYNERPITVRAAVDAEGNWPADEGKFNPVTVDGVEGLFIEVPAETELTIRVGDYGTDPTDAVIYQTYDYTSDVDRIQVSDEPPTYEPVTTNLVLSQNTYVSGTIIYKEKPGRNLKVVLENLTDTSEDDISILTEGDGSIPQTALPFSTNFRVTVWTLIPDTTNSLELVYTHPELLTTGAAGGSISTLELAFGVADPVTGPLIPVIPAGSSAIVATVLDAEGNPATGDIWISPEGAFGATSIAATIGDDGELSQLEAYMGAVLHEGFVVLDPAVAYYEIREGWSNIIVDQVVTPGAGVVKNLSLVKGEAPMTESYISGLVLDAEGNPATGDIWISPEGA
ncbi:hypothetical protein ACFL1N_12760, partial [Thermodesulfobacteriota bacterium]